MTTMYRYRSVWSNFAGAPGYTNIYSDGTPLATGSLHLFFNDVANYLPNGLTITLPTFAEEVDDTTGEILGTISTPSSAPVVGSATAGPFAGASGGFIDWICGTTRIAGRQLRGRTFMVPLDSSAYSNTGQLNAGAQTALQNAANDFLSAAGPHVVIWARPYAGRDAIVRPGKPTLPAKPARVGSSHVITGGTVPFMQAQLRSRRT